MRQTDLEELPDFFYWCGLEPHEEGVDTAFFVQELRRWATLSTCSFSMQLREAFRRNEERHIQSIAELARIHFRAWDGSKSARSTGIRMARILIQLTHDGRGFELYLHPSAPDGFPEGIYGREELVRVDDSVWFEPLSEQSVAQWLSGQAVELTHERFQLTLPPRSVVPFLADGNSELGGWLSTSRVRAGENHRILCHVSMRQQVESYLHDHGEDDWRVVKSRDPIYRDWTCFVNVRITQFAQPKLDDLDCLVPAKMVGIRSFQADSR